MPEKKRTYLSTPEDQAPNQTPEHSADVAPDHAEILNENSAPPVVEDNSANPAKILSNGGLGGHGGIDDVEKAASLERLGEATNALAEKLAQKQADREAGLDEPRYFWNRKKSSPDQAGNFSMLGTASTMGLHMVSGPIAGGFLGWLIDGWLNSEPIGLGIGILLGLAAGFRNVWADARHLIKGQNSDASGKNPHSPRED